METADGGESNTAIFPRPSASKKARPILSAEDFPEHIVTWEDKYAEMDLKTYNDIYRGKSKKIHRCFTMCFNVEGESYIKKAASDLKILGAKFTIKPVQQLKTDSTMACFGVPNSVDPSAVQDLMDDVLKPLEQKLMIEDPNNFPAHLHDRTDWVEYSMTKAMPFGMPYEKYDSNAEWKPNGKLSFIFQVAHQDTTRLFSLLAMAKENDLWKNVFGRAAFTVQMIPGKEKDEDAALTTKRECYVQKVKDAALATKRKCYVQMVQDAGAVQLSMGQHKRPHSIQQEI